MFDRILNDALRAARIDIAAFDAAIKKEKFKSRMDWFLKAAPASLVEAYNENVMASRETVARRVA
jgi:hypothetical protein